MSPAQRCLWVVTQPGVQRRGLGSSVSSTHAAQPAASALPAICSFLFPFWCRLGHHENVADLFPLPRRLCPQVRSHAMHHPPMPAPQTPPHYIRTETLSDLELCHIPYTLPRTLAGGSLVNPRLAPVFGTQKNTPHSCGSQAPLTLTRLWR